MGRAIDKDNLIEAIVRSDQIGSISTIDDIIDIIEGQPVLPQPSNEALTLEELREMSYTDWVWVVFPELPPEENCWYRASQLYNCYSHEHHGKTWIAYRCPPEGGRGGRMTNADKIRSMSDEELAEFLSDFKDCAKDCLVGKGVKDCSEICATSETLRMWLQQPEEEET